MTKLIKCFAILIFCVNDLKSQDLPKAVVLKISGQADIYRKGRKIALQQKDIVSIGDTIGLQKSAVLKLFTQAGKIIETKGPARFIYIVSPRESGSIGITEKFLELLWHDLIKPSRKTGMNPEAIGGAVGGAKRGCNISKQPANGIITSEDTLHFAWDALPGAGNYVFTLKDAEKNEIFNIVTTDTFLILLKRGLLKAEVNNYYWNVTTNREEGDMCDATNSFAFVSKTEMKKRINELVEQVPKEPDDFIYNLKISNQLALKGYYREATEYYEMAYEAYIGQQ